jgi:serine/threonine protein kinase
MDKEMGENGICKSCGFNAKAPRKVTDKLPLTTSLKGRYMVGRVLGQGGFGITYVGYDIKKNRKIAIKEYYPNNYAERETSSKKHTVYSYSSEDKLAVFNRGLDRFVKEGQRLSKFASAPGIVTVYDMFKENGTFYIVMEFVSGKSLKQVLKEKGGRLPEQEVLKLLKPVIVSLGYVHSEGLIHRDIAPDNIMIQPDGTAKLIDFGAASEAISDGAGTIAMHKPGYAPEEQYDTSGHQRQGTWTDVYAISATIFKAIEGKTPPDAIERLTGNKPFNGFTLPVSESTKKAIMHGLEIYQKDRIKDISGLLAELFPNEKISIPKYEKKTTTSQSVGTPPAPKPVPAKPVTPPPHSDPKEVIIIEDNHQKHYVNQDKPLFNDTPNDHKPNIPNNPNDNDGMKIFGIICTIIGIIFLILFLSQF